MHVPVSIDTSVPRCEEFDTFDEATDGNRSLVVAKLPKTVLTTPSLACVAELKNTDDSLDVTV